MSYIDYADYVSTPPTEAVDELREEHRIAVAWLRSEIAERDAVIQEHEQYIGELLREISGIQ